MSYIATNEEWLRETEGIPEVNLMEMLTVREQRVYKQLQLLQELPEDGVLINLNLNIAGPVKRFPAAEYAFNEGLRRIEKALTLNNIKVLRRIEDRLDTGLVAYFSIQGDPLIVKNIMVKLEDEDALGRLYDIDVLILDREAMGNADKKIARSDIGAEDRGCLICGATGRLCARNRAHSVEELQLKTLSIINEYRINKDEGNN